MSTVDAALSLYRYAYVPFVLRVCGNFSLYKRDLKSPCIGWPEAYKSFVQSYKLKIKMKVGSVLITSAFLLCVANALDRVKYSHEELVVMGCKYAVTNTAVFCKKDTSKSYKCQCSNKPALGSWLNCIYEQAGEENSKAEHFVQEYCEKLNKTYSNDHLRKAYKNATEYLTTVDKIEGFNKTIPIDTPIKYKQKVFKKSYESYKLRYDNVADSIYFGSGLLAYWALILLAATIVNFASKISVIGAKFNSKPFNKVRQYVSMPSLFSNKKHTEAVYPLSKKIPFVSGLLPTRVETIVLFFFFALMVIFQAVRFRWIEGNTIWKSEVSQISRYVGDRSGILCLYGFQLTFLFAGRNNLMLWLTGWKQATFVTYHKWISRFNFLLLVVHAASMHIQSESIGKFQTRILTYWYRWGIIAGVTGGVMLLTGSHWVRKNYYETFLLTHIVMGVFFLIGTWLHADKFHYEEYAYAMAAIWCFDRAIRIGRLVSFGVRTATATVVSDETLKITIPKHKFWKAYPGAFGYVHFLKPTTFFQSHPFTIVSDDDDKIVFYTKIKGGVTSQIHRYLRKQPNQTGTLKVTVEGPYGDPKPLKRYDTALLYAGGNGIPGLYAYAKKLAEKTHKRIKLYWVIRNWHSIDWFYEELLKLKGAPLDVILYVTKPDSALGSKFDSSSACSDSDSKHSSEKDEKNQLSAHEVMAQHLDFVEFRFGRPNIDELIKSDLQESTGNVGVMSCAHNAMVDSIRYAVSQNLETPQGRVDYFEELQQW